jgi:hypothetical protein
MKNKMKEVTKDVETQISRPDPAQTECFDLVLYLLSVCLDTSMINTV